jgi:hypothetical protein
MTDLSKCQGNNCEVREMCYRYTAPVSEPQSWLIPEQDGDDCDDFILNWMEDDE